MIPDHFYLGGGSAETLMTPLGAMLFCLAGIFILFLPRKYVIVPVLLAVFLVPRGLVFVVGGFHLISIRIISLMGWIRLAWWKWSSGTELIGKRWNSIDSAMTWCGVCGAIAFCLLWLERAAVFNQIGILWSTLGMYFLLRALIRDKNDVYTAIKVLAVVAIVNAGEMIYEQLRFQNLFGTYIGGLETVPLLRDGKIRSQGVFGHAILAGTFAATLLPLLLLLVQQRKAQILAAVGVVACVLMVYTCASSTPALAIAAGILAICFWPVRREMRMVRWGIVAFLIMAQIFMKAPVWFLIAHMDVLGASSGYHRAELVDTFIKHFFDWWLVGTRSTGDWGWDMFDTSNYYVAHGESGGLLAFIFFIALISRSFRQVGRIRKAARGSSRREWFAWFLGAALFAHVIGFIGITYWDQTEVAWFALLAMISAGTVDIVQKTSKKAKTASVEPELVCALPSAQPVARNSWTL